MTGHTSRVSRDALAATAAVLDRVVAADAGASGAMHVADDLFAVVGLLDREIVLRRALADPVTPPDERAAIAEQLIGSRVSSGAREVVAEAVRQRWSRPRDLVNALDDMAVRAVIADADAEHELDAMEDELFRFRRIVAGDTALRHALSDQSAPTDSRLGLAGTLLDGKVTGQTKRLVDEAIRHPRTSTLDEMLERFGALAAEHRARLIARVRSAVTLTDDQQHRLAAVLRRLYGHDVVLDVEVDPAVLGGLAIEIGDEVIDGTVLARLDEARRRLAH